jgi:hypothetical protein
MPSEACSTLGAGGAIVIVFSIGPITNIARKHPEYKKNPGFPGFPSMDIVAVKTHRL